MNTQHTTQVTIDSNVVEQFIQTNIFPAYIEGFGISRLNYVKSLASRLSALAWLDGTKYNAEAYIEALDILQADGVTEHSMWRLAEMDAPYSIYDITIKRGNSGMAETVTYWLPTLPVENRDYAMCQMLAVVMHMIRIRYDALLVSNVDIVEINIHDFPRKGVWNAVIREYNGRMVEQQL